MSLASSSEPPTTVLSVAPPASPTPSALSSSSRTKKWPRWLSSDEGSPSSSQQPRPPPSATKQRKPPRPSPQVLAVERILNQHTNNGEDQVLIEWKGIPLSQATWEPVSTTDCPNKLLEFLNSRQPSSPTPALTGVPLSLLTPSPRHPPLPLTPVQSPIQSSSMPLSLNILQVSDAALPSLSTPTSSLRLTPPLPPSPPLTPPTAVIERHPNRDQSV